MASLSAIQDSFANALLDVAAPTPEPIRGAQRRRAGRRFDIHRNNIATRLIGLLATRYPVTCRLIGTDSFSAMARLYTLEAPPRAAVLLDYGEELPRFIRSLGSMPSIAYLADIAELESARCRAYHAADASPTTIDLTANRGTLDHLTIQLHPSASLVNSRFPVVSIWETNLRDDDSATVQWKAEAALVARPDTEVLIWRLPVGGHCFFAALMNGLTCMAAANVAKAQCAEFDLATNLDLLTKARICVGFNTRSRLAA
jgi:hypothetical protein